MKFAKKDKETAIFGLLWFNIWLIIIYLILKLGS